jgi:two-component system copper resistance phosphate regulon response regulator CusR
MAQGTATLAARKDSAAVSRDCRRHLLLVEDEPGIADFLTRGLRAKGYPVTHTADGTHGHHLAATGGFALVILDWMIPGKPGRLVLDALHDSSPELPILVMSASEEARRYVTQMASGAIRFVGKPFAINDLLTTIRDLLEGFPRATLAVPRTGLPSAGPPAEWVNRDAGDND